MPDYQRFKDDLKSLGFYAYSPSEWERRNRNVSYDDDCSDDEHDDSYYDRWEDRYHDWADPIVASVRKAAKARTVPIEIETASEYGSITVYLKEIPK